MNNQMHRGIFNFKLLSFICLFLMIQEISLLQASSEETSNKISTTSNAEGNRLLPDPEDIERCEKNFSLCQDLKYYPSDIVEKYISEGLINETLSFDDESDFKGTEGLSNRIGPDDGYYIQLCTVLDEILSPKIAKNSQGQYRFILQIPEARQASGGRVINQAIRIQRCFREGDTSCNDVKRHFSPSLKVRCVQRWFRKKLIVFDENGVAYDSLNIPSCCICMHVNED